MDIRLQLSQKDNTSFPCPRRGPRTKASPSEFPGIVDSGAKREKTLFFLPSGEAVSPELQAAIHHSCEEVCLQGERLSQLVEKNQTRPGMEEEYQQCGILILPAPRCTLSFLVLSSNIGSEQKFKLGQVGLL